MDEIIAHMKACGWVETVEGEKVYHPEFGAFDSWERAVKACIEVASGN